MRFPLLLVSAATIALLLCLTLVVPHALTAGGPASYYDAQAWSWLDGKWDMEPSSETIEINGKHYIYFGPLPALLRLPSAVWPRLGQLFSQYTCLFLATLLNFCAALLVFRSFARYLNSNPGTWLLVAFSLIAGPASSLMVIASRPSVYHEAIAFGSGFTLMTVWAFAEYIRVPAARWLAAVAGFGLCAVMSRQTWLLSVLFLHVAIGWFALRRRPRDSAHFKIMCVCGAAVLAAALSVNFVKFGWRMGVPLENHAAFQKDPEMLRKAGGALFHLSNLRAGLANYFATDMIDSLVEFPYIGPAQLPHLYPETKTYAMELFISLPWTMGATLLLSAFAVYFFVRSRQFAPLTPLLGCWLGSAPVFLTIAFCGRYLHDFYPPLICGAAIGLIGLQGKRMQILAAPVLAILIGTNLCVDLALAYHYQYTFFRHVSPLIALTSRLIVPRPVFLGGSKYPWPQGQSIAVRYRLNAIAPGGNYPLLTTGQTGAANFVWLRIGPTGLAQYCFNSWGNSAVPCSGEYPVKIGEAHILGVEMDEAKGVLIRHDGEIAIQFNEALRPVPFCRVGENRAGGGLTIEKAPAEFEFVAQPVQH